MNATAQANLEKAAITYDAALDYLYRIDDNYVQPFYAWAAPQLRDAAISGLYWSTIAIIDTSLWLIDTTRQFMTRDAQAIALVAFAQAHEPAIEFPALTPAAIPLALPYALPLAPAQIAVEDPWEAESDYELVEFSPSIAAQAFTSPMLLLAPASAPPVVSPIWNPAPGRDMHTEVERLLRLQHVPLTLAAAPAPEQPAPEPVKQSARRGRGQIKAADAPAIAEDELAMALDVPGATGGKQCKLRAKASAGKAAAAKPKQTRARAKAKTGAK